METVTNKVTITTVFYEVTMTTLFNEVTMTTVFNEVTITTVFYEVTMPTVRKEVVMTTVTTSNYVNSTKESSISYSVTVDILAKCFRGRIFSWSLRSILIMPSSASMLIRVPVHSRSSPIMTLACR